MTFELWLQTRLVHHGARIAIDGDIGRVSIAALKAFQAVHGLSASGIADSETTRALREPAKTSQRRAGRAARPGRAGGDAAAVDVGAAGPPQGPARGAGQGGASWSLLGDPAKLPWCCDAVESAIAKTLPDEHGVHRIGTTDQDMAGWREVTDLTNALAAGGSSTPIQIVVTTWGRPR